MALMLPQVCTALVTGTAGCAGATLQQEPTPPRTARIIFPTWTTTVSSKSEICSALRMKSLLIFVVDCYLRHWIIEDELFTKFNVT